MKRINKFALLASAVAALSSQVATAAPYTAGDLLVGFRASGGTGASQTYTVDIGNAALLYRDATAGFSVTSIGADLSSTFGANWATRSDVFWGIVGVRSSDPGTNIVNGDNNKTIYASQDQPVVGIQSAPATQPSSTQQGTTAGNITDYEAVFAAATANAANPKGAIIPTSTDNDYAELQTGVSSFGSTFGNDGIEGNSPFGIASTALDLYRINNVAPRVGSYEGTFTLGADGGLAFRLTPDAAPASEVPEPVSTGVLSTAAFLGVFVLRRRQQTLAA